MKNKLYIIKHFLIIIGIYLLLINNSLSEILKKFDIIGNERLSKETIIMFSNLNFFETINKNKLNNSLKELYSTNYFKDVSISSSNGTVKIIVKENPIIQSIKITGIDNNNIYENIREITSKTEKYPFVESEINNQLTLLKNILKSYGYYFVKLETLINSNPNNSVDLIYNFELGQIAKIKKLSLLVIRFIKKEF